MDVKVEAGVFTITAKTVDVKNIISERVFLGSSNSIRKEISLSFIPVISVGGHSISAINPEKIELKELAVSI